jgi:hypothetical protein
MYQMIGHPSPLTDQNVHILNLGTNTNLDLHLQGGPNFRAAELDTYGVGQPTVCIFAYLSFIVKHLKYAD